MNGNRDLFEHDGGRGQPAAGVDVLITRIVDGEASGDDRDRFELLAGGKPHLWRTLALRQQDQRRLDEAFEETVAAALEVDLPATDAEAARRPAVAGRVGPARWGWGLGWAAAVLLAVVWLASGLAGRDQPPARMLPAGDSPALSPDELLSQYLASPRVLAERPPMVLEVTERPDGRLHVVYERRIEEFVVRDPSQPVEDESGHFIADPEPDDGAGPVAEPPPSD